MKKFAIILCAMIMMSASCKKNPPTIPEDLVIQIITTGEWSVTDFKLNGNNLTLDFAGWRFKYFENKTVDAKFNGNVMNTGTWDGSQSTMTTTANFPGAAHPVTLVTGTWSFVPSGSRVVEASQTIGADVKTMKLYRE
ncbi:MAG: hypothetical protein H7Y01_10360 [Ferruginibacter sp.]|nr:hypothetical protein [Chitinophagaceae bacterium]